MNPDKEMRLAHWKTELTKAGIEFQERPNGILLVRSAFRATRYAADVYTTKASWKDEENNMYSAYLTPEKKATQAFIDWWKTGC